MIGSITFPWRHGEKSELVTAVMRDDLSWEFPFDPAFEKQLNLYYRGSDDPSKGRPGLEALHVVNDLLNGSLKVEPGPSVNEPGRVY